MFSYFSRLRRVFPAGAIYRHGQSSRLFKTALARICSSYWRQGLSSATFRSDGLVTEYMYVHGWEYTGCNIIFAYFHYTDLRYSRTIWKDTNLILPNDVQNQIDKIKGTIRAISVDDLHIQHTYVTYDMYVKCMNSPFYVYMIYK